MNPKDDTSTQIIDDILAQLTPMHLSFSTRSAEEFTNRVEEAYKETRKNWLKSLNNAINTGEYIQSDHKKLDGFREDLVDLAFANTPRKITDHNDAEIFVKGEQNLKGRTVDLFAQFSLGKEMHSDMHEFELICDMLVRSGVEKMNVFTPYLLYQRE